MSEDNVKKKTFGDWLKSIFNAHYGDASDDSKRFVNTDLKAEIENIAKNYKLARSLAMEFSEIQTQLEKHVMKCKHDIQEKIVSTNDWEQCNSCGCSRIHKYTKEDFENTYFERSLDIMDKYKELLDPDEFKTLNDFYNRNIGDMSIPSVWKEYDGKLKILFEKYPIWSLWRY